MANGRQYVASKKYIRGKYPRNFSRNELIHSDTAEDLGISNEPISIIIDNNLINLAHFLQEIRERIEERTGVARSISISSGYRCPKLNKRLGGSYASDHIRGAAADIKVSGWSSFQTVNFILENMPELMFGQIINEFGRWVHISLGSKGKNREVLTAVSRGGRTVYERGNHNY